jgi:hypothetical protein
MRFRVVASLLGAMVLLGAPTTAASADGTGGAQHRCRIEWYDLYGLHGENGNPEGPVPELDARWDAAFEGALQHAHTATVDDCGAVIDAYAEAWDQLELFMYDLHPYDALGRLAIAEGDRQHALHFHHVHHLSKPLERAFDKARKQAPLAAADLTPAMSTAPSIDVADPAAVKAMLYQLKRLAKASPHEDKLDHALRVIGNAELDEE